MANMRTQLIRLLSQRFTRKETILFRFTNALTATFSIWGIQQPSLEA